MPVIRTEEGAKSEENVVYARGSNADRGTVSLVGWNSSLFSVMEEKVRLHRAARGREQEKPEPHALFLGRARASVALAVPRSAASTKCDTERTGIERNEGEKKQTCARRAESKPLTSASPIWP